MKRFLLCVSAVLFAGSLLATHEEADPNREGLLKADRDFAAATAALGLEGFETFLAENAGTLRADKPVVSGKVALLEDWKPLLTNPALSIHWEPISASSSKQGDLGYTVGSYSITKKDAAGERIISTGKYLTVWRKDRGGAWKVEFDSGVADSPQQVTK